MVELTSSRVDSPTWSVGDRKSPNNDTCADVVLTRSEDVSIIDLQSVRSRIGLESTEVLMHILPVGKSILQGESNRLCSHKARGRVDNDSVGDLVAPMYILSMGSLGVGLNRCDVLEHRHIEVM